MFAELPRVLTLEETANYLRVSADTIEEQVMHGQLPGRRIENSWRFLRDALDDWLRSQDDRLVLLQQTGALVDDDNLLELLDDVYKQRGRPEVE